MWSNVNDLASKVQGTRHFLQLIFNRRSFWTGKELFSQYNELLSQKSEDNLISQDVHLSDFKEMGFNKTNNTISLFLSAVFTYMLILKPAHLKPGKGRQTHRQVLHLNLAFINLC